MTYLFTPVLFWWMMPVLLGLVLAAPIIRFSSSLTLGRWARKLGIFVCPCEHREPDVLRALRIRLANMPVNLAQQSQAPALPAEHWLEMPVQSFQQGPMPSGLPSLSN